MSAFDDVRNTSAAQIAAYRDERRAVKLFRPRFHDGMPLKITMSGAIEQSREYVAHPVDSETLYFEATKTVRGAKWLSVDWTETLPPNTDIIVLARVGDSPDWAWATPVPWNDPAAAQGRVVYKFDTPIAAATDNAINAAGDSITLRVFFKFNPGYSLDSWQMPVLKSLSVRYEAGSRVIESQELDY